jgi:hypothetical protein
MPAAFFVAKLFMGASLRRSRQAHGEVYGKVVE